MVPRVLTVIDKNLSGGARSNQKFHALPEAGSHSDSFSHGRPVSDWCLSLCGSHSNRDVS